MFEDFVTLKFIWRDLVYTSYAIEKLLLIIAICFASTYIERDVMLEMSGWSLSLGTGEAMIVLISGWGKWERRRMIMVCGLYIMMILEDVVFLHIFSLPVSYLSEGFNAHWESLGGGGGGGERKLIVAQISILVTNKWFSICHLKKVGQTNTGTVHKLHSHFYTIWRWISAHLLWFCGLLVYYPSEGFKANWRSFSS